jgi:hypothetical protein
MPEERQSDDDLERRGAQLLRQRQEDRTSPTEMQTAGCVGFFSLICGFLVGFMIGGCTGANEARSTMKESAVKAGVGQYNATTGLFEWKKGP